MKRARDVREQLEVKLSFPFLGLSGVSSACVCVRVLDCMRDVVDVGASGGGGGGVRRRHPHQEGQQHHSCPVFLAHCFGSLHVSVWVCVGVCK